VNKSGLITYIMYNTLQLADLVELVRGKLKKIARMMLSALIVIEVSHVW